ncbi:hypothetical protein VF14_34115 [Nostoc linckia z18]|uniref:Uncharacterized protein n=2 Tax=Nostoc linckia TaxID=92942 RepID=A0A9Q5Z601_NOSLI|nr:hypothetical protein VF02_34810 [Nostoc linckia z1]PHJ57515.1 hypothetical protein VF05_35615 [Nostoc linckia z3]PHJ58906.1 hypothetical protein VF03_35125 [Nostoc linckia z2]PHJ74212.1 hypothetical protein VF06_35070 [Nostoc linckia z4]PHJ81096.1 hypothetical protein VF07_30725 [Nostoc linckia z6]PHJ89732.1 hypothetical protein VF04_31895 [Nostoc linckia z7]PHJ95299.1 hypothetical protein VF08_32380 [Nostoc linckia z8]PHK03520.1 hypothetical protein VF09_29820 [Nostoc linckia z9]PHK1449
MNFELICLPCLPLLYQYFLQKLYSLQQKKLNKVLFFLASGWSDSKFENFKEISEKYAIFIKFSKCF